MQSIIMKLFMNTYSYNEVITQYDSIARLFTDYSLFTELAHPFDSFIYCSCWCQYGISNKI